MALFYFNIKERKRLEEEIETKFANMDKNNDGILDAWEVRQAMPDAMEDQIRYIITT